MSAGFDALLEFLGDKIALCGEKGARKSDIRSWVEDFYSLKFHPSQDARSLATPPPPAPVDDAYLDKVWSWTKAAKGIITKKKRFTSPPQTLAQVQAQRADSHDKPASTQAGQGSSAVLPPTAAIEFVLTVDEQRMWRAITGHGIDRKKVPSSLFQLLSIIAAHGKTGIHQPDLVRLSGQDKRSVPQRTADLAKLGYIYKKTPVLWQSSQTSWCVLRRICPQDVAVDNLYEAAVGPPVASRRTNHRTVPDMAKDAMDHLRSLGQDSMVTMTRLRAALDVVSRRTSRQTLNIILIRMSELGWVKLYYAQQNKQNPILVSVSWLRTPTSAEMDSFEDFYNAENLRDQSPHLSQRENIMNQPGGSSTLDEPLQQGQPAGVDSDSSKGAGTWRPGDPLSLQIFEHIENAPFPGLGGPDIAAKMGFNFFKKPLEVLLARLTDHWAVSQPGHLRRFTIVRDVGMRHKSQAFLYRTVRCHREAVQAGKTSWEAVGQREVSDQPVGVDEWGFTPQYKKEFVNSTHAATMPECYKSFLATHAASKPTRRFKPRTNPFGKTGQQLKDRPPRVPAPRGIEPSPSIELQIVQQHLPQQKQWRDFMEQAANMAKSAWQATQAQKRTAGGNERRRAHVMTVRELCGTPDLDDEQMPESVIFRPKRPLPNGEDNRGEDPAAKKRKTAHDPDMENTTHMETLASLQLEYFFMLRSGLFLDPPLRIANSRGRRKKRILAVFKSEKLQKLGWFKDFAQDDASTSRSHIAINEDASGIDWSANNTGPLRASVIFDKIVQSFQVTGHVPGDMMPEARKPEVIHGQDQSENRVMMTQSQAVDVDPTPAEYSSLHETHEPAQGSAELLTTNLSPSHRVTNGFETIGDSARSTNSLHQIQKRSKQPRKPKSRSSKPTAVGLGPLNARKSGGTIAFQRREVIMLLLERNGGVYPGDREIAVSFAPEWRQRYGDIGGVPDGETAVKTLKSMVDSRVINRHFFTFLDSHGIPRHKSVVSVPGTQDLKEKVGQLQQRIMARFPHYHVPELNVRFSTQYHAATDESPLRSPAPDILGEGGDFIRAEGVQPTRSASQDVAAEQMSHQNIRAATVQPDNGSAQTLTSEVISPARTENGPTGSQRSGPSFKTGRPLRTISALERHGKEHGNIGKPAAPNPTTENAECRTDEPSDNGVTPKPLSEAARQKMEVIKRQESQRRQQWLIHRKRTIFVPALTSNWEIIPSAPDRYPNVSEACEKLGVAQTEERLGKVWNRAVKNGELFLSVIPLSRYVHDPQEIYARKGRQVDIGLLDEATFWQHLQPSEDGAAAGCIHALDAIRYLDWWELELDDCPAAENTRSKQRFINVTMGSAGTHQISDDYTADQDHETRGPTLRPCNTIQDHRLRRFLQDIPARRLIFVDDWDERPRKRSRWVGSHNPRTLLPARTWVKSRGIHEDEAKYLIAIVTVMKNLTGATLEGLDWRRVGALAKEPHATVAMLKYHTLFHGRATEIQLVQNSFEEAFIAAYRRKEVPFFDPEKQDTYDWAGAVKWTLRRMEDWLRPDLTKLPKTRELFDALCEVEVDPGALKNLPTKTRYNTMADKRRAMDRRSNVVTLRPRGDDRVAKDTNRESSMVKLAKNYIRANIMTPNETYDLSTAKAKLWQFGDSALDQALKELTNGKLIIRKGKREGKKQGPQGRDFSLNPVAFQKPFKDQNLSEFKKKYAEATRYKSELDLDFASPDLTGRKRDLFYFLKDGEAMELVELWFARKLSLQILVPPTTYDLAKKFDAQQDCAVNAKVQPERRISIWGFSSTIYKTMHIDFSNAVYPIRASPLPSYTPGSELIGDMKPTRPPVYLKGWGQGFIPMWVDINGSIVKEQWALFVGAVSYLLAFRPGQSIAEMRRILEERVATEAEIEAILEWLQENGLVSRAGTGWRMIGQWQSTIAASIADEA